MANKQINELTEKSTTLADDDLILVWDSEEGGSEKSKKIAVSNYVSVISSVTNVYVSTTGSDTTGDGSSGSPWASIAKAVEWSANKIIPATGFIIINVADGTYNGLDTINFIHAYGSRIKILGNTSTPANVTLNFSSGQSGFYCHRNLYMRLEGLKIVGGGSQDDYGIQSDSGAYIYVSNSISENWYNATSTYSNGWVQLSNVTLNNNYIGIFSNISGGAYAANCAITNNTYGVSAHRNAMVSLYNSTYSGNSNDTDTSLNGTITVG